MLTQKIYRVGLGTHSDRSPWNLSFGHEVEVGVGASVGLDAGVSKHRAFVIGLAFPEYHGGANSAIWQPMKRVVKVDAQGREELLEEVQRHNAQMREIERESAERTGRAPVGPVVRVIALPAPRITDKTDRPADVGESPLT